MRHTGRSRLRHLFAGGISTALGAVLLTGCVSYTDSGDARLAQAESWSAVAGGPRNASRAVTTVGDEPTLTWSRALGAPLSGTATSTAIGTIYQATVSASGCNIFALDAEDGRKKWCTRLATNGPRITATIDGRGTSFLPQTGGVVSLNADGEIRWFAPMQGTPTTIMLLDNQRLLVITQLGVARIINAHTGLEASPALAIAGDIAPSTPDYGLDWCQLGTRGCVAPGPAAVNTETGSAYLTVWRPGMNRPELVSLSSQDGELSVRWRTELPNGRLGAPVVLSDSATSVYQHSANGDLTEYSTADGSTRWTQPLGYQPDFSPALLPNGTVVTGGRSSTVWRGPGDQHPSDAGPAPILAIRTDPNNPRGSRAELAWRRSDLNQLTNPVATADGRVIVATRSGERDLKNTTAGISLQILNGDDGTTLREIPVPAASGPVSGLSVDASGRITLSTALGSVYVYSR